MARLEEITGKALSGEWGADDEIGNGIPVLRTTNFTNEGKIDFTKVVTRTIGKNVADKLLRRGDILIEKSGGSDNQPVGRVVFYDGAADTYLFNNFTGLLRVKDTFAWVPKYVFYALLANYTRGGTRHYENRTTGIHNLQTERYVSETEIPDKPFAEQEEIVSVLDRLNGLLYLRKQQLAKLDELVKARFVELFGTPEEMGKKAESSIQEIADVQVGLVIKPTRFYSDAQNNNRAFRSLNVGEMRIIDSDWVYFTDSGMNQNPRTIVHTGDVLVVRSGYPGTSCVVTEEYDGSNVIDLIIAHPHTDKILPEYLSAFTNFPHGKRQINAMQHGIAQKHFNVGMYENMKISIPPIEQQKRFLNFLRHTDKTKQAVSLGLNYLETLKAARMQHYFG